MSDVPTVSSSTVGRPRRIKNSYRRRKEETEDEPSYTMRPCICCGQPFKSQGKFNRLCPVCKDTYSAVTA